MTFMRKYVSEVAQGGNTAAGLKRLRKTGIITKKQANKGERDMENRCRCEKCGEELELGMKICPVCNTPAANLCQKCAKELKPHWAKCPWCETPVKQEPKIEKCQQCGEELEGGMVACPVCGKKREGGGDSGQSEKEAGEFLERAKAAKTFDDAIRILDEGIGKFSSNAALLVSRAERLIKLERYNDAIRDCNEAVRLESENAEAYRQRSIAHRNMEDYDKALADANEAIHLAPGFGMCFATRANARKEKRDFSGALEDYDKGIELAGSDNLMVASIFCYKSDLFMEMENIDAVLQSYSHAIRLAPERTWFLVNRANAYYVARRYDEAIADLTKAIGLNPDYVYAYFARGDVYKARQEYDRAIADYEQAMRLAPEFEPALHSFNNCLIEQIIKQFEDVLDHENDHFLPNIPRRMLTAATSSYAELDEDEYIIYLHFWKKSISSVSGHCFTNKGVHDDETGFHAYTDMHAVEFKDRSTYADRTLLIKGSTAHYAKILKLIVELYD